MSQMVYTSRGCEVIATHRPSGEADVTATAATAEAAAEAARIITKAMRLNDDRKYTQSARTYALLDSVPGYVELDTPYPADGREVVVEVDVAQHDPSAWDCDEPFDGATFADRSCPVCGSERRVLVR